MAHDVLPPGVGSLPLGVVQGSGCGKMSAACGLLIMTAGQRLLLDKRGPIGPDPAGHILHSELGTELKSSLECSASQALIVTSSFGHGKEDRPKVD